MIAVEHLSKRYVQQLGSRRPRGTEAVADLLVLDRITLTAEPGQCLALLGRSGSGKSSLLNILGLLDSTWEGHVRIDGVDLQSLSEKAKATFRNQKIGFVFQSHHLLPEVTALENVMLPLLVARVPLATARSRAQDLLAAVFTPEELQEGAGTRLPAALSGGQRQRVAIARALVMTPKVLLADEPTGNLDESSKALVFDQLKTLAAHCGTTVVMATHDLGLARQADLAFLLHNRHLEVWTAPRLSEATHESLACLSRSAGTATCPQCGQRVPVRSLSLQEEINAL